MSDRLWITDFKYDDGAMLVKNTGHRVPHIFAGARHLHLVLLLFLCADMAHLAPGHRTQAPHDCILS